MSASVLVADDDPNIVLSLEFLMKRAGYRVRVARDGDEVLAAMEAEIPDLVLLDLRLPDGNGIDLLAEFHAVRPRTRVIVMTAHGTEMTEAEVTSAGAYALVHKPFDLDHVVRLTQRAAAS